jgi:hypothetical protein
MQHSRPLSPQLTTTVVFCPLKARAVFLVESHGRGFLQIIIFVA